MIEINANNALISHFNTPDNNFQNNNNNNNNKTNNNNNDNNNNYNISLINYDNHIEIENNLIEDNFYTQSSLEETIYAADNDLAYTTPYVQAEVTWDTEGKLLENSLVKLRDETQENACIMDNMKTIIIWWCYNNGSLKETNLSVWPSGQQMDLSFHNISSDEDLKEQALSILKHQTNANVLAFSVAFNNLTTAPFETLELMSNSLKYLTLRGNPFVDLSRNIAEHTYNCNVDLEVARNYLNQNNNNTKTYEKIQEGIDWATFPQMPELIELDISHCNIEFITKNAFENLTSLRSLYMGYNKMLTIPSDVFVYLPNLQILDLSFTNVYDSFMDQLIASPTLESVLKLVYGCTIQQNVFKHVPNLIYLDLSHTKLTRSSAVAFSYLGSGLRYMSLCYTSFPVFGNGLFRNTSLEVLDISGNNLAAFSLTEDVFEDMPASLMYLYFERANIRDLAWLKHLTNLRFLALTGNNINTLNAEHFKKLPHLQALDLSSNQVGNWYSQVFNYNENLRILSLRDNNINIITSEMLKDFSSLVYLSLGDNNFICDCLLRDLIDVATVNNQKAVCKGSLWSNLRETLNLNVSNIGQVLENSLWYINTSLHKLDVHSVMWSQNVQKQRNALKNLKQTYGLKTKPKLRFVLNAFGSFNAGKTCLSSSANNSSDERFNGTHLKLQLLDYDEERYWCYNETKRQNLIRLNCQRTSMAQDIVQELDNLTTYVWATIGGLISLAVLSFIIYWKRWHIYYYYSSLKSAALLSAVSQDHINNLNSLYADNPNMIYDIFISYCQSDRDWIVKELMPNVEESGDISICLHERDFQIGVTILDNIVSCMERSRALMLIISSNFLLSHWCQFEMHMAQHRVFDLKRDHLILVLLEDIPRSKRPKNLQYLMEVKTYIKWPGGKTNKNIHPEERKLFWKRLKRTLKNIGVNPVESRA